jgi:hypothetical protein
VGVPLYVDILLLQLLDNKISFMQNREIKVGNRCFENVPQFRYLEMTITNQNMIEEEIKRRLNSDNVVP